jgi:hypothetical protein
MFYSIEEKITMIKWYYMENSYRRVSDMFSTFFPERPIPSKTTVQNIVLKFETKGTVINKCNCLERNNNVLDGRAQENNADLDVLLHVEENKGISTRLLGKVVGKDHSTVLRKLKKYKYHPYKYQRHQELREGDEIRRADFCFEVMEMANNDRDFLRNICFTDECTFTLNNEPNVQNFRYWSKENEHRFVSTRTQYPQKVNVWAGIFGHRIIGPFFLNHNLGTETFLELLQNQVGPALEEIAPENQDIWFQMDGCPAHNSREVREYVQNVFNGLTIGPNYTINWPARSPDLSPNDFFLWGHIKNVIYKNLSYQNLEELKVSISAASDRISAFQLHNVRTEFYNRLGYCLAVNGGLFEHLIKKH